MNAFYEWVRGIACYLLLVSLLMLLLPEKKYQKYLKLATGLVFILLVAGPLMRLLDLDGVMEGYYQKFESYLKEEGAGEIPEEKLIEKAEAAAVSAYETWVKEEAEAAAENMGYEVAQCRIQTAGEGENKGELEKVYLKIRRKEQEGWLVEPVVIGKTDRIVGSRAARKLEETLRENFGLSGEQIWIEEES